MTHFQLLRNYFQQGFPTEEKDNAKRPHALPHVIFFCTGTGAMCAERHKSP